MSAADVDATVTRFKFFWAHDDGGQETWLRAMARQGLHLVRVNPLCFWTFRRGAPADIVYRVDYTNAHPDPAFRQLMQDAGWTLAANTVGWHYWRTPAVAGKVQEIFTDAASKARRFQQLLGTLLASGLPLCAMFVLTDKRLVLEQLSLPFLVPLGLLLAVYVLLVPYSILRLLLRIRQAQGPLPA